MTSRWCALLTLSVFLGWGRLAAAQPGEGCTPSPRPFVTLRFGEGVEAPRRDRIVREIDHELAEQRIDVCDRERPGAPVATVELDAQTAAAVSIRLQVRDALTSKDVARTVDTSSIPADGRALFVAVAVVELLRASWAELAVARALPPLPAPPEVRSMVQRSLPAPEPIVVERVVVAPRPPPRKLVSLAIAMASEAFTTGLVRLGMDASVGIHPLPRLGLIARVGFRRSLVDGAPDGSVESESLLAGASARLTLTPPGGSAGLDVLARFDVVRMTFLAHAGPGALAATATLPSIELSGGARCWLALTPTLDAALELTAGGALLAASATDAGASVSSTAGAMVTSSFVITGYF